MEATKIRDQRASQGAEDLSNVRPEDINGGSVRVPLKSETRLAPIGPPPPEVVRPAGLRIERQTVTPEQARYWLAVTNVHNRPLNKVWLRQLISDRMHGRWKPTHQGIAFDTNGHLVDGQHRLHMVVATNLPTELTVAYGLEPATREVVDQTYKRAPSHTLATEGITNAKPVSSLARTILVCTETRTPTHPEVIEFTHKHMALLQRYAGLSGKLSAGTAAAFVHAELLGWQGIQEAGRRLSDLDFSGKGDPMQALGKALRDMGGKSGTQGVRVRFFTALNALRAVHEKRELTIAKRMDKEAE